MWGIEIGTLSSDTTGRPSFFYLIADIDGRSSKYMQNKACPEYEALLVNGIRSIDEYTFLSLIAKYLLKKNL